MNYASIIKPLSIQLGNKNEKVIANKNPNMKITLDENALKSFNLIKEKLQENIELFQPNSSKPFELTTDTSNKTIGAMLSQHLHPITFVSRTLSPTEQKLTKNEKELLAIIWALKTFQNYLCGIAEFTILTDHQPLTNAMTDKNSKFKLWKTLIEESGAKILTKSRKENTVNIAI